jgi:hypothetical protein
MSGYANWLLSAILLIGAAIGGFFGLFKWIKTQQQIPQSRLLRFAAAWRYRLIPIMLACMGVAGAILIVGAIAGAIAYYGRQPSDMAVTATADIIRDPKIVGSNDPNSLFTFYGTFAVSGTLARIYLDFDRPDRNEIKRGNDSIITYPRRVKLPEFSNFTKAEPLKVTLISFDPPDARVVLRWGAMTNGPSDEADRFMLTDPMDARVTVIDNNENEQDYSFWLRPKIGLMQQSQPYPPMPKLDISNIMLITQDIVNTQSQWK